VATICELNLGQKKVQIEYPTHWEYKVIVPSGVDINAPIKEIFENREFSIKPSHTSKKGSYESFNVTVLVTSDTERQDLFNTLKSHQDIKYVL
jgi:putative lipoic acid-binding regulatory protein